MITDFTRKCIADIKANISLPIKNSAVIGIATLRFCYRVRGAKKFSYIYFATLLSAAQFLMDQGKIYFYTASGSSVRLYQKHLETTANTGILQVVKMKELLWPQLTFTKEEIIHYAALNEYHAKGAIIGLFKSKVVNIAWDIYTAA